ncbi:MAG: hypothetical protein HY040_01725 [Planctomycetes bacterium]|nr:hypothetical protein [Planctomycetota bacterium]
MAKRNSGWIWYFAIVFGLAVLGTVWLGVFNLNLQLTQEQFTAAREKWIARKPADYDLVYTIKNDDESQGPEYSIRVRGGKLVHVLEDGVELCAGNAAQRSMEAMFELMQKNLDAGSRPGAEKVYVRARFHEGNGAVLEYVRRVMGTRRRLEISVKKFRFGDDLKS